ncbi:MAG: allantoate deiminase [Alkalibacterium sp.]|nr:allantoate deiminase [Alkalibacterium sp.]TVP90013.1 MAG: allantoate deiminase [Alkalibacterium sp.]
MEDNLGKRLKQELENLNSLGADPSGGLSRLLYSKSWVEAQEYVETRMEEIGMHTFYDEVGNLFGRIEGTSHANEVIMTGSHIDTVANGGSLDGQYGVIAAYLAVQLLKEQCGDPKRSIEVVSLAEEEGSRFPYAFWGSKNLVKTAEASDVKDARDRDGIKFTDAMKESGFDFRKNDRRREDIKAFLEIHIEQGSVLEKEEKQIGVVTGIVGQQRYTITLKGQANHAGTTPMGYRKDAVYAFSKIVSEAIEKAEKEGDPLVLTFGRVDPKPNTVNVVPGEVTFSIDCRHTDKATLKSFTHNLIADIKQTVDDMDMDVEIDHWMDESPVPMDEKIINIIKEAAEEGEYSYKIMPSGAGHDAQIIAPYYPTGLVFVPSIDGISHNPDENTKLVDLVEGVKIFADTLYKLAYEN